MISLLLLVSAIGIARLPFNELLLLIAAGGMSPLRASRGVKMSVGMLALLVLVYLVPTAYAMCADAVDTHFSSKGAAQSCSDLKGYCTNAQCA